MSVGNKREQKQQNGREGRGVKPKSFIRKMPNGGGEMER